MHVRTKSWRSIASVVLGTTSVLLTSLVNAESTIFTELSQTVKAPTAVAKLGPDLFGDQVNLYTGVLSFEQVDLVWSGTGDIPLRLGRKLAVGKESLGNGGRAFGFWDLDIPYLYGTFESTRGWLNTAGTRSRCSQFSPPPPYLYQATWHFEPEDYWHGNYVHIPGGSDQLMLLRNPDNTAIPTDGNDYPVVTPGYWAFSCLPALANNTGAGEGFVGVAPNGARYRFDHMVSVQLPTLNGGWGTGLKNPASSGEPGIPEITARREIPKGTPLEPQENAAAGGHMARKEYRLMPTLITDRFGNTVTFTYDPARPNNLLKIQASDGRSLTFLYQHPGAPHLITSATDGTRTWTYTYSGTNLALDTVKQPDGSTWKLAGIMPLMKDIVFHSAASCELPANYSAVASTGTMTHPSGATGTFTLTPTTHGRSRVPLDCLMDANSGTPWSRYPAFLYNHSLTTKTITGPGLAPLSWKYDYGAPNANWADCAGDCPTTKTVTVTDPSSQKDRYTFGNEYLRTEGKLQVTETGWDGQGAARTVTQEYQPFGNNPYPEYLGYSTPASIGDADLAARPSPLLRKTTTQLGEDFVWSANQFDHLARPTWITRAGRATREETIAYQDIPSTWVLGSVGIIYASPGVKIVENSYDDVTGAVLSKSENGLLRETLTYHTDGNVKTRSDAAGQTTTYEDYKLGIPRKTTYADQTTRGATVNDIGLLDSTTDELANTTKFGYDTMGRLARVSYPAGDSTAWADLTISFEQVTTPQHGLTANFWRKTVQRGTATETVILDALWRPVLNFTSDTSDGPGSNSAILRKFDHNGAIQFESYPQSTIASVAATAAGITTQRDALGRFREVQADSEQGVLTTRYFYRIPFQKSVLDPRGFSTNYLYQVFDEPVETAIMSRAEHGTATFIYRDPLGIPTRMHKGTGEVSAIKQYVYDEYRRLCKTIEPEGITVQAYDSAGNIAWRAHGQAALTDQFACQQDAVTAAQKINYRYDLRNRLTETYFGDTTVPVTRTYYPDGQLWKTATNGTEWTYTYNKRRLLETETLSYGGKSYKFQHGYNPAGYPTRLTYPDLSVVDFDTNALGRARKVGTDVTAVKYHPNGAVASFTYGNGIAHTMTQNTRGLPERVTDVGVIDDIYTYDPNGNVKGIEDKLLAMTTRTMEYTGRDQLLSATAPALWGKATYAIDSIDNIRSVTIEKGITARTQTFNYDTARNRIASIQGATAAELTSFGYDQLGNVTTRGSDTYKFDGANRMLEAVGKATYVYDGHGRRVAEIRPDRSKAISVYSLDGKLLYSVAQPALGKTPITTAHRYLNDSLVKSGLDYVHTDGLRSVVAKTRSSAASATRTRYEPYGLTAAGAECVSFMHPMFLGGHFSVENMNSLNTDVDWGINHQLLEILRTMTTGETT